MFSCFENGGSTAAVFSLTLFPGSATLRPFRPKTAEFGFGSPNKRVRHVAAPVATRLWSGMTGSLRARRSLVRSSNLLCPAASRKAGGWAFLATGNPTMTTAPSCLASSRRLLERFENLYSRVALLRDICVILAAESCSQAKTKSISPAGWEGLTLLCEETVSELEQSINAFSELMKMRST